MPASRRNADLVHHPVVITFLILAVIAFLSLASEFLKPLALAVLLSFALAPLAAFLERRGLPRAAAVVLTILLALGILGAITFKVGQQLTALTKDLPKYTENLKAQLHWLEPGQLGALDRLTQAGREVASTLDRSPEEDPTVQRVKVVSQPTFTQRLQTAVGPYLEQLGVVSFVLILVLFMLNNREDLRDRIIRLFGTQRVSLTTRTMDEVGTRISRYLGMFTLVNSIFGLIIGLGLWAIGVPFPVLWGVLFALLRFIPYVGPAVAFALPLIFTFASFKGLREPLMVVALFGTLETVANSFLEPVIYGRTTGVSALGLLVAAMFWTWLWGALGLLLSTPLTVCMAVLGKYVSGLRFFAIMLGEEAPLEPDVRFYQRLLAVEQEEAMAIVETALKQQPRAEVFDQILIPALSRAERDRVQDNIDEREQAFIWRVIGDLIGDLEETPEIDLKTLATASEAEAGTAGGSGSNPEEGRPAPSPAVSASAPVLQILGVPANDQADVLVLQMLSQLLPSPDCALSITTVPDSPLRLAEEAAHAQPDLLLVSHLPPAGSTTARYLVRRLRARFSELPILVGRWGEQGDTDALAQRLTGAGASRVAFRLAEARDLIVEKYLAKPRPEDAAGVEAKPGPALVPAATGSSG